MGEKEGRGASEGLGLIPGNTNGENDTNVSHPNEGMTESGRLVVNGKHSVSFKEPEEGVLPRKKDHTVVKVDRSHTMSGQTKAFVMEAITLKFEDVRYKVTVTAPAGSGSWNPLAKFSKKTKEANEKEILHGIAGSVLPGEVLAMLGPSGGGKTSFLNVLGGRTNPDSVSGILTYNDLPYSKALKRKIGFVTQDDIFFPHLTVRETLMYAAILRLPAELSHAEKIARADETISELGLDKCKDTIIGGPFLRGISGGERKRCSIGHEILTNPSLLFLDEPTSGLDSTTALRIVHVLQNLAKSGRTIVTTIHQPSSRLYHSFHKLLLLSEGNSIFFGHASEAMDYFERLGFAPMFATNPADFLLDLATGTTSDITIPAKIVENEAWETESVVEQQAVVKKYLVDAHRDNQLERVKADIRAMQEFSEVEKRAILERREWTSSWTLQFSVLWTRGLKERRHEFLSPLRFYQVIALAIICGLLWWNSKNQTEKQVQDQVGIIFFISIFWGFFPLFTAIFTFPQERAILAKERATDMYRLSSYFLSRTLSDLPMEFLLPTLFLSISYFMMNLRTTAGAFFLTILATYLIVSAAQGAGFFLGAAVMDVKVATTYASVLLLSFMLAGGYYIQHIPPFINWIKYISFTFYAYRLLLKIQYQPSQTYGCGPTGEEMSILCPIGSAPALRKVHLDGGWQDAAGLLVQIFAYRILTYVALRRMKIRV